MGKGQMKKTAGLQYSGNGQFSPVAVGSVLLSRVRVKRHLCTAHLDKSAEIVHLVAAHNMPLHPLA